MRRSDREVTDKEKIQDIIDRCTCCRLGFCDEGEVYIVPLSFGYAHTENGYVFYFHGAKQGRKIDLIRATHKAGFEMDTQYKLKEGAEACAYSARFQSIIGNGMVEIVEDFAEKKHALVRIMQHNTGKADWEFPDQHVHAVGIFKLTVTELSCKVHA